MFAAAAGIGLALIISPERTVLFPIFTVLALVFGVLLIIPIGGADMPTVIALLNSYAGLSASAMGFVLNNKMLIVAGALDGSSGFILAIIMCRAMNRSFGNVLFGAFGQLQTSTASTEARPYRSATADEAAQILDSARTVVVIPGYGMAVAQAQHKLREMYDLLTKRGINVEFAIHPVAGRMPGHMNVLLAEADVPYDKLREMDDINPEIAQGRCRADHRSQRCGESRRRDRSQEPHRRDADHPGLQGPYRDDHQAQHEPRFCRHRQRSVLHAQHASCSSATPRRFYPAW